MTLSGAPRDTPITATVESVAAGLAFARQQGGALLLDVREPLERAIGAPDQSVGLTLAEFAHGIEALEPDKSRDILTICASGKRSLVAAAALRAMGYSSVTSVTGGFQSWQAEKLPLAAGAFDADSAERYSRHLLLPQVGVEGQRRLSEARVVLLGAGGLGSPAALYLVAAGVGHLRIVDDDCVDRSNLQRQILHTDARIGTLKTESAYAALSALNPRVRIERCAERLGADNVEKLLAGNDVVIDGADNFPARYLLSAACLKLKIPLVYGAVHRFTGQTSVFDARREDSPCYRCLFPEPPAAQDAPNCAQAGVLGVLPGTIGMLQATETIKLLLGIGDPLVGRLLCYDALQMSFREIRLARDPACPGCSASAAKGAYENIAHLCSL